MFVFDVPPDVPPQYAPVVIAQASQAKQGEAKTDRTVGICQALSNPATPSIPGATLSAQNALTPDGMAKLYFRYNENRIVEGPSKTTVLESPNHGKLEDLGSIVFDEQGRAIRDTGENSFAYRPEAGFLGEDSATFLVEIGSFKVKMIYLFKVEPTVDYKIEDEVCPEPRMWKISLNPDDPNAPIYTFEHPSQLTSAIAGVTQGNLTFADLARLGKVEKGTEGLNFEQPSRLVMLCFPSAMQKDLPCRDVPGCIFRISPTMSSSAAITAKPALSSRRITSST